jgi:hypothetical protein
MGQLQSLAPGFPRTGKDRERGSARAAQELRRTCPPNRLMSPSSADGFEVEKLHFAFDTIACMRLIVVGPGGRDEREILLRLRRAPPGLPALLGLGFALERVH